MERRNSAAPLLTVLDAAVTRWGAVYIRNPEWCLSSGWSVVLPCDHALEWEREISGQWHVVILYCDTLVQEKRFDVYADALEYLTKWATGLHVMPIPDPPSRANPMMN